MQIGDEEEKRSRGHFRHRTVEERVRAKNETQMIEQMTSVEEGRQDRSRRRAGITALALHMFAAPMENRVKRFGCSIFAGRRNDGQLIR